MTAIVIPLKAISFLQVPPQYQMLWRDCLISHCTAHWSTLNYCRETGRIKISDAIPEIVGEMIYDYEPAEGGDWKRLIGHFIIDCNHDIFEEELKGLDTSGDLDSIFWPIATAYGNGLTRWRLDRRFINSDGKFEFYTKPKYERREGELLIYRMGE